MARSSLRHAVTGSAALISAGATSLTGLLVNLTAARSLTTAAFGRFSVVYVVVLAIVALLRATSGEVVLFGDSTAECARRSSSVTVALLAAAGTSVLVVLGIVVDESAFAAAATLVPICLQDNYRYLGFAAHRPGAAAVSDIVTLLGPAVAFVVTSGDRAGSYAMLGWGLGAVAGCVTAELMLKPGHVADPRPMFGPSVWGLRTAALSEFASAALLYQVPVLVTPLVAGYSTTGVLRGLQMVYSPVTVVHAALFAVLVPRLTKRFEQTQRVASGPVMLYLAALTALTLVIAVVLALTPADIASRALGDIALGVRHDAWTYGLVQWLAAGSAAVALTHRVAGTYRTLALARLGSSFAAPVLCGLGAWRWGVTGACIGLGLSQLSYIAPALRSLAVGHRRPAT